jgi:hypothetical protein
VLALSVNVMKLPGAGKSPPGCEQGGELLLLEEGAFSEPPPDPTLHAAGIKVKAAVQERKPLMVTRVLPSLSSWRGGAGREKAPCCDPGGEFIIHPKGFADYDPRRDAARSAAMGQGTAGGRLEAFRMPNASASLQTKCFQSVSPKSDGQLVSSRPVGWTS